MTDPMNFDCNHGIPSDFKPEPFLNIQRHKRCKAYLLAPERQCRSMAKRGSDYCGWHDQPLVSRACALCKKERDTEALIRRERKEAERSKRKKRVLSGKPTDSRVLTNAEKKQIQRQKKHIELHASRMLEAVSLMDEHLRNSGGREFDRGLKMALDGEVASGLEIMRAARVIMNAESFDESALLDLLEKPRYLLEIDGVISMETVLDVMSDYVALALRAIPSDNGRAWFIGKLRGKFGKAASQEAV